MSAYGQSKHLDKLDNNGKPAMDKIYSYSTMDNYIDVGCRFANWAKSAHGCKTIDDARQYTGEYLKMRMADGKSAYTVRRDAAGLAKLYQVQTTELGATLPIRRRQDVTQHRGDKSRGNFDAEKYSDLVELCRSTGLRRHEVAALRPEDVVKHPDGTVTVHVKKGKGGKERTVTALSDAPMRIADKARQRIANASADNPTPATIIEHIPSHAPIHEYRAQYAQELYDRLARPVKTLPISERYHCRAEKVGVCYDRQAMKQVSIMLGHNRLDVVTSYIK